MEGNINLIGMKVSKGDKEDNCILHCLLPSVSADL
jgi:hypothetical protein